MSNALGGITDTDGRLRSLFAANAPLEPGIYRLTFETASYFADLKTPTFYPRVEIVFEAAPARHIITCRCSSVLLATALTAAVERAARGRLIRIEELFPA